MEGREKDWVERGGGGGKGRKGEDGVEGRKEVGRK